MRDKEEIKGSLTTKDIQKVFKYYNIDYFENKQGVIQAETACHNRNDGSHKLYYYPDSNEFHCYTGCSQNYDIYGLIQAIQETRSNSVDFPEALNILCSILDIDLYRPKVQEFGFNQDKKAINDWDWIEHISKRKKVEPDLEFVEEKLLSKFPRWYTKAWYEEGISIETQKKFGIRYYPERNQTVIPHRDYKGRIIGVRVRNWNKEDLEFGKYMPLYYREKRYTHPLGFNLYALYENKEAITRKKKLVITESEKSAMLSHSMFGENNFTISLCGSSMNQYQADLIMELGVEKILIAMDKDFIGTPDEEYMNKVNRIARLFINKVDVYHLTDTQGRVKHKENMFDMGKDIVIKLMEEDKHKITELEV